MKKFLSIILCVLILCATLPLSVFADEIGYDTVSEAVELREENVKHFLNPDGSYTALAYSKPVHRLDENGNWQDLENIMNEETRGNKQAYITSDGRTVFSKKINSTDNEIFTLNEGKYEISVSFVNEGLKNTTAKLSNHAKKYTPSKFDKLETQYKKLKEIDTTTTLLYKNALSGVDLEYVLSVNDIKENIIVRKLQDEYSYSFIYELNGLIPELNDDGSISLKDKETLDTIYSMPAPFMVDNSGEASQDVEYILTDKGNDTYEITVHANAEWINSPERDLPVVIDPTVELTQYYYYDTYISPDTAHRVCGNDSIMYVSDSEIAYMRPLSLPDLPDDAIVEQALLNVYYYYPNYSGTNSIIHACPIISDWDEQTLTWYSVNSYDMGVDFYSPIDEIDFTNYPTHTATSPGMVTINVTGLYKDAYAGKPFYGVALRRYYGNSTVAVLSSENTIAHSYCILTYNRDALLQSDVYFIQSAKNTDKFVNINENGGHSVKELNYLDNEKWSFENLHNGYYKITNVFQDSQLCVPYNKVNLNDAQLELSDYQSISRFQWKITETSAGSGVYKISPRSNLNMFISLDDGEVTFQQRTVQSDSKDSWFIKKENSVTMLSVLDGDGGHRMQYFRTIREFLKSTDNTKISKVHAESIDVKTEQEMIYIMQESEIFMIHAHGKQTGFQIGYDAHEEEKRSYLEISELSGVTFEKLDFVVLLTCQTGVGYDPSHIENNTPVNIIEQLVLCGVETVIGFNTTTTIGNCNKFGPDLMEKMVKDGMTVREAIDAIEQEYLTGGNPMSYSSNIASTVVIAGNENYCY